MTSQDKAINYGTFFLSINRGKNKKTHQYMHLFLMHVLVCFNSFINVFLTPIHVPYQRAPIMGFVDVYYVNCSIWGWNNSTNKHNFLWTYFLNVFSSPFLIFIQKQYLAIWVKGNNNIILCYNITSFRSIRYM